MAINYLMNVFQLLKCVLQIETPLLVSYYQTPIPKQRKNAKKRHDVETDYRLQEKINQLIRKNQLKGVNQNYKDQTRGSKRWWSVVNGITGRSNSEVPISSLLDPQVINMYFQSINTDIATTRTLFPLLFLRVQGFQKFPSIVL